MKRLEFANGDGEDSDGPHRLADAEPAEQPGPTDDDGDGIVWRDDGETCPACGGDLEGGACVTCGFEP